MFSIHLHPQDRKKLMKLSIFSLILWIAMICIILLITQNQTTRSPALAPTFVSTPVDNPLGSKKFSNANDARLPNLAAMHSTPVVDSDNRVEFENSDEYENKMQQAVLGISNLVENDTLYTTGSAKFSLQRQTLSKLIKQNPQITQILIDNLLQNSHSPTSAELIYTLGQNQSPDLEKIIANKLATATDEEKIYLYAITQHWKKTAPTIVDSALQNLRISTSDKAQISSLAVIQSHPTSELEIQQSAALLIYSILDSNPNLETHAAALRTLGSVATTHTDLQAPLDALSNENDLIQSAALHALSTTSITSEEIKDKLLQYASTQPDDCRHRQALSLLKRHTLTREEKKLAGKASGCEIFNYIARI
jgi:hypothetical protein